jgi:hypothetical protein
LLLPIGAYTIIMSLRYALALPACVVENTKARPSLRRSIDLSKGARGRIFLLALLIGVVKIGLVLITQVFTIVGAVKNHGQLGPGITAISQIIEFFTTTFLGPIWATGVTLLYYDQRVRKEGFDIEWMMQAAGLTAPPPAPFIEAESAPLPPETPIAPPNQAQPEPPTHAESLDPAQPAPYPATSSETSPETPPATSAATSAETSLAPPSPGPTDPPDPA